MRLTFERVDGCNTGKGKYTEAVSYLQFFCLTETYCFPKTEHPPYKEKENKRSLAGEGGVPSTLPSVPQSAGGEQRNWALTARMAREKSWSTQHSGSRLPHGSPIHTRFWIPKRNFPGLSFGLMNFWPVSLSRCRCPQLGELVGQEKRPLPLTADGSEPVKRPAHRPDSTQSGTGDRLRCGGADSPFQGRHSLTREGPWPREAGGELAERTSCRTREQYTGHLVCRRSSGSGLRRGCSFMPDWDRAERSQRCQQFHPHGVMPSAPPLPGLLWPLLLEARQLSASLCTPS